MKKRSDYRAEELCAAAKEAFEAGCDSFEFEGWTYRVGPTDTTKSGCFFSLDFEKPKIPTPCSESPVHDDEVPDDEVPDDHTEAHSDDDETPEPGT
jgi:hypothetical protein